jgi:hypothetical protein
MTKRIEITPSAEPLEAYAGHFDDVFGKSNQREEFRRYLEGLLLPTERHKTLTGLVNTEPVVGAEPPRAQKLHWFRSRIHLGRAPSAGEATQPAARGSLDCTHGARSAGDR